MTHYRADVHDAKTSLGDYSSTSNFRDAVARDAPIIQLVPLVLVEPRVYKKRICTFQIDRFIPQELQGLNSLRVVHIAEPHAESQQQGAAVLLDCVVRLLYTFRQTIYIIVLTLKHLQSINICMYCLTDIINYSHLFSTFS